MHHICTSPINQTIRVCSLGQACPRIQSIRLVTLKGAYAASNMYMRLKIEVNDLMIWSLMVLGSKSKGKRFDPDPELNRQLHAFEHEIRHQNSEW